MRTSPRPSRLSTVLGRSAVAGVAVLASTVGAAPAAHADDADVAPPTDEVPAAPDAPSTPQGDVDPAAPGTGGSPDTTEGAGQGEGDADATGDAAPKDATGDDPTGEAAAAAAVAPDFGEQKYLVGVQVKDGSYVEDGATTDGSTFTIRTTLDGTTTTTTCTAQFVFDTLSICPPGMVAPAGATVEVVQDTAGPGLTKSDEPLRLEPCTLGPEPNDGRCGGGSLYFENTGPLPDAVDDDATTDEDTPVRIDVLGNDTSNDPGTTVSLDGEADHGDVELVGEPATPPAEQAGRVGTRAVPAAGTQAVVYTPDPGFTGTDTFTYRLTNSNGSNTATVTVDVVGEAAPVPPSTDVDPDTPDQGGDPTPPSAQLPDTGGSDVRLLGLGGLLVAAGAALARGRRREDVA